MQGHWNCLLQEVRPHIAFKNLQKKKKKEKKEGRILYGQLPWAVEKATSVLVQCLGHSDSSGKPAWREFTLSEGEEGLQVHPDA